MRMFHAIDLKAANKILSSAQTREKALKIFQYASRLLAYVLLRGGQWKDLGKHFEALSKSLSTTRRFFKFFRFMKHFEDLAEAKEEKNGFFQKLLYLDVAANVVADVSEDVRKNTHIPCVTTVSKSLQELSLWSGLDLVGKAKTVSFFVWTPCKYDNTE
eukprot:g29317.t1